VNILDPEIKKGDWSNKEQELIFEKLPTYLTSWSMMAAVLTGRTENSIKNYFYSSVRRLKTSSVFAIIKDVYLGNTKVGVLSFDLENEVQKLNTLSKMICLFLLSEVKSGDVFREFLNSVIFGSEEESQPFPKRTNSQNSLPSYSETSHFGKLTQSSKPLQTVLDYRQMDGQLIVPNENITNFAFKQESKDLKSHTPLDVLELIKKISEAKKCFDFSTILRFFEDQVGECKMEHSNTKLQLRIPHCWHCSEVNCHSHVFGN